MDVGRIGVYIYTLYVVTLFLVSLLIRLSRSSMLGIKAQKKTLSTSWDEKMSARAKKQRVKELERVSVCCLLEPDIFPKTHSIPS